MANKYITVSNGDGRNLDILSASVDNATGQLSASLLTINTASFSGSANMGILQVVGGQLTTITGSGNNYKIIYEPTLGRFQAENDSTGSLGGDLSGLRTNAKVIGIGNVTTGTLPAIRGGTGTGSFSEGALVTSNGDGPIVSAGNANKVVTIDGTGNYAFVDKSILNFTPLTGTVVYLYTGSYSTTNAGSFVKSGWSPPVGTRFIRVICQGGGGGGGGGHQGSTAGGTYGGGGGGGGGYADVIFNALTLNFPITIVAGNGGYGASAGGTIGPNYQSGYDGGSSSFGNYIYSSGGGRGYSTAGSNVGGTSGIGYITFGGSGGKGYNASVGVAGTNLATSYGAPGGGGGGGNLTSGVSRVGYGGGSLSDVAGGSAGQANETSQNGSSGGIRYNLSFNSYYLNGIYQNGNFPQLVCAGGGGGGGIGTSTTSTTIRSGAGGSATFGAGGGGSGGRYTTVTAVDLIGAPGDGGKGYVLIICY